MQYEQRKVETAGVMNECFRLFKELLAKVMEKHVSCKSESMTRLIGKVHSPFYLMVKAHTEKNKLKSKINQSRTKIHTKTIYREWGRVRIRLRVKVRVKVKERVRARVG